MLMLSMGLPTAMLTAPAITVRHARQDAWLSIIIATAAGLVIARLVASLSIRFPGKTLFEYAEEILGKVPWKIVGLFYIWWFLHVNALVIRELGIFMVTAMMPDTPIIVFHVVGVAVVAYTVRNGLKVLSRFNQLFIPVTGLLAVVFLLSTKDMKLTRLLPVFEASFIQIVKGAALPASLLGEIVTHTMIIPYLDKPREAHRVATLSILLMGLFLTASVLESLLIFGLHVNVLLDFSGFQRGPGGLHRQLPGTAGVGYCSGMDAGGLRHSRGVLLCRRFRQRPVVGA